MPLVRPFGKDRKRSAPAPQTPAAVAATVEPLEGRRLFSAAAAAADLAAGDDTDAAAAERRYAPGAVRWGQATVTLTDGEAGTGPADPTLVARDDTMLLAVVTPSGKVVAVEVKRPTQN